MPLKSRSTHPPGGGFSFFQPQTDWRLKGGLPFEDTVKAILQHRRANPGVKMSLDIDEVREELDAYTCARLRNDPAWCNTEKKKTVLSSFTFPTLVKGPVALLAERFSAFKGVMQEWLGNGLEPVSQEVANARAKICSECPLNVKAGFLESVTGTIADGVKKIVEFKAKASLQTQYDSTIDTCDACGCYLPIKVWVPGPEIKSELTPELRSRLHPLCWQRSL